VAPRPRSRDEAIHSAEAVTFMRALMAREPDEKVKNPDHLAVHFLSAKWRLLFRPHGLFKRLIDWYAPGCIAYHIARTKHGDDLVLQAARGGVRQFVLLGAGNDTRPYRFRQELSDVRIFELDFPGTQARKKAQLTRLFGALPGHVTFVPIDFNTQSIEETLKATGYDPSVLTFFNWEGVCCFLPERSVDQVLRFVARSAPGSGICFDYSLRSFVEGDDSSYGAKKLRKWNTDVGEPHLFGMTPDEVAPFLRERELELVSDLGSTEAERRYLTRADGSRLAASYGMFRLVYARAIG
jgi:methyltransferase (TIGR00027 family)